MCKRFTTTLGLLPNPLFRQCKTCGSGSEEGKVSQPRIPHERKARRSGALSRVPTLRPEQLHYEDAYFIRNERGPRSGSPPCPFRPGLGRGASVDATGAGSAPAGSSGPRRHALGHSPGVPAVNLVSRVGHGCPRLVSRRSMRVMRTNTHCAIGMVVAFAATAGVHRESGTSRFGIIQRRTRCVSECSLVFCP